MLSSTSASSTSTPTGSIKVRDPRTGEERLLPPDALVFHVPGDLGSGEPVQVRLDADPKYPAGDLQYQTDQRELRQQLQRAAYRLDSDLVKPRTLWLVPESTPGREHFYYPAEVKPDVLGSAGAEVYTPTHRYSAVVRGAEFSLTVVRFDEAGKAVDPVRYTGSARVLRGVLAIDLGAQAAAVPDVVLAQLYDAMTRQLGLDRAETEQGHVATERGYGWLCRHEDPRHFEAPLLQDANDRALCPLDASRGRGWIVLTAEDEAPRLPPGWSASAWAPSGGPDDPAGLVIWADNDLTVFAGKPIHRSPAGHERWLYAVVS